MKLLNFLFVLTFFSTSGAYAREYSVQSPDGALSATVSDSDGTLRLSLLRTGVMLMQPSAIGINGVSRIASKPKFTTVKDETAAPFYRQQSISTEGRQMDLRLSDGFGLQIRAYNQGIAYRFYTTQKGETTVETEKADYVFGQDTKGWFGYSENTKNPLATAFQNYYDETTVSKAQDKLIFLPLTLSVGNVKVTLLESDLRSYPGMFMKASDDRLSAVFAPYPKRMEYHKWRGMTYVAEREQFIARTTGQRTYPWRVFAVTTDDTQMPVNDLVRSPTPRSSVRSTR